MKSRIRAGLRRMRDDLALAGFAFTPGMES